jgi:hypothetical protein
MATSINNSTINVLFVNTDNVVNSVSHHPHSRFQYIYIQVLPSEASVQSVWPSSLLRLDYRNVVTENKQSLINFKCENKTFFRLLKINTVCAPAVIYCNKNFGNFFNVSTNSNMRTWFGESNFLCFLLFFCFVSVQSSSLLQSLLPFHF